MRSACPQLMLLLTMAMHPCVDPSPNAGSTSQAVLCSTTCTKHCHVGWRRIPFLKLPTQLTSLAMPLSPLSAKLLVYLSALRGIRGGATAMGAAPSEFSFLGLSELGQTSTDAPDRCAKILPPPSTAVDFHSMKLIDLQRELRSRGLSVRGLKSDLIYRLQLHIAENPQMLSDACTSGRRHKRDDEVGGGAAAVLGVAKKKRGHLLSHPLRRNKSDGSLELLKLVETVQHADDLFEVFQTQAGHLLPL
jgi:hypothetical protein